MPAKADRYVFQRMNYSVTGLVVLRDLFEFEHWVTILQFKINRVRIHWIYEQIYGITD